MPFAGMCLLSWGIADHLTDLLGIKRINEGFCKWMQVSGKLYLFKNLVTFLHTITTLSLIYRSILDQALPSSR
jgi:hypothetical protein